MEMWTSMKAQRQDYLCYYHCACLLVVLSTSSHCYALESLLGHAFDHHTSLQRCVVP